jgi:hypothetical protein
MNTITYIIIKSVTSEVEAEDLSTFLTSKYGADGFKLISTTQLDTGKLLIGLMAED